MKLSLQILVVFLLATFVSKAQIMIDNFDSSVSNNVYDPITEGGGSYIVIEDNTTDFVEGTGSMDFRGVIASLHDWGSFANLNYRVDYANKMDWTDSDTLTIWLKVLEAPAHPESFVFRVHVADMPAVTSAVEEYIYENAVVLDATSSWVELKIPFVERVTDGNTPPNDEGFVVTPYGWGLPRNNSALDKNAIVGYNIVGVTTSNAADSFKVRIDHFTRNTGAGTVEPIILDGVVDDDNYETLTSWGGADNWSSNNDLGDLKMYADGNKLYVGLSGKIEENWNKIVIFTDFNGYDGIPAGTPLPTGGNTGFFQDGGIAGTILNMETDFVFSFTCDGGNPLYCDAAHYNSNSMVAGDGLGYSGKDGSSARFNPIQVMNILGGTTGQVSQAYLNDFDRTNNPDHGLELCIDITAFQGVDADQFVKFFVGIVNADGNYWSNELLPDYFNATGGSGGPFGGDFGNDPDFNTVAINAGVDLFTAMQPLPVELASFNASVSGNQINLDWTTASESNNKGFFIERSFENSNWEVAGFVDGAGTSNKLNSYSFADKNIENGNYTYRLKQVNFDGSFNYSKTVEVSFVKPLSFSLDQNYPNPFNPSTKIAYSIPKSGNVTLSVYNILGQKVVELVNGFVEAGQYTITFDAQNLNSGIYFYKIESNNFVQVKKMTLMK